MKNYQNQLDRFCDIAKKLVDDHSAELFTRYHVSTEGQHNVINDAYYQHLDVLGKQLDEQAQQFITSSNVRTRNEHLKSDIWSTCKKYIDQFVKRNEPRD
jgi:hypothetical protein